MSGNGSGEIVSPANGGKPDGGFLGLMRAAALVAVVAGAAGSVGLMFRAGQHTPRFLMFLFTIWVLAPFVALLWVNLASKRWPVATRATLYCTTLIVTLGSLAVYGELVVVRPPRSPNALLFVAVPPASWVFMTIVVSLAALISGRLSRRS